MQSTLRVSLVNDVTVFKLQAMLAGIHTIYMSMLWLERAESIPRGQIFPEDFSPDAEDDLWIESLEIGTPNWLTLKGQTKQLAYVATFLATLLAVPVAGTEAVKNYAEAQKAFVESDLHRIEIIERAERLYKDGKITENDLRYKLDIADWLVDSITATLDVVSPQTLVVSPVEGVSENISSAGEKEQIAAVLKSIGKLDALPAALQYLQTQIEYRNKRDAASLGAIGPAYDKLFFALAPMPDDDVHKLIDDLLRDTLR